MVTTTKDVVYSTSAVFNSNDAKTADVLDAILPPTSAAVLPDNQFYVKKITLKIDQARPGKVKIPNYPNIGNPKDTSKATTKTNPDPEFAKTDNLKEAVAAISEFQDGDRLKIVPTITIEEETTLSGTTISNDITKPDRPQYPTDSIRYDFFKLKSANDAMMLKYYQLESSAAHDIFISYNDDTKEHYVLFDIFHNKLAANAGVQISLVQDSFDNPSSMTVLLPVKEYTWSVVEQTVTKVSLLVKIGKYSKTKFNYLTLSVLIMGNQIRI